MLLMLEEIGIEMVMILATVGALACFVFLLAVTWRDRRGHLPPGRGRAGVMRTLVWRAGSSRSAHARTGVPRASSHGH